VWKVLRNHLTRGNRSQGNHPGRASGNGCKLYNLGAVLDALFSASPGLTIGSPQARTGRLSWQDRSVMTDWFSCNNCKRAFALPGEIGKKCPSCGGTNGEVLTREQMKRGVEAGAYFSIDLRTGKSSKRKTSR